MREDHPHAICPIRLGLYALHHNPTPPHTGPLPTRRVGRGADDCA